MHQSGANPEAETSALSSPARAVLHAGFVLTGMVTTLLGPILPLLAARWALTDAQAGLLFSAQFLGSLVGAVTSNFLIPRRGFSFSLLVGFGLMAGGIGALGFGSWAFGLIAVFSYGIGLGVTIPTANLFVADAFPGRRAAAVSLLNLAWGIGAVTCPPLIALLQRNIGLRGFLVGLAAALSLLAVLFGLHSFALSGRSTQPVEQPHPLLSSLWRSRAVVSLGVLFFLYVGTENALGGWVASYAKRVTSAPGSIWALTPSFFWGALLLGRAVAPAVLRVVAEAQLVLAGLFLAAGGTIALLVTTTLAGVMAGASVVGLGLAPIFPILVAWLSQRLGGAATRTGGAIFALGGLGGATLPWLVGFASTRVGTLQAGLVVPLTSSLLMLAFELSNRPGKGDASLPPSQTRS